MNAIKLFAVLLVLSPAVPARAAEPGNIELKLEIQAHKGPIYCRLFASAKGYPMKGEHAQKTMKADVKATTATCRFIGVPPGSYAIMAFHDLNDNGKLDTNWMGIPREGVVASNNAKGRMGPPSFKDASFKLEAGGTFSQSLKVKYYH